MIKQFNIADDTITTQIGVTNGFFDGGVGTLAGSGFTTSSLSAAQKSYYYNLQYNTKDHFSITYGHILGSGSAEESTTVEGTTQYFKEFDTLIGLRYLNLFHINDSKAILNSRKDLHQGLGEGYIYGKDKGGDIMALKVVYDISKKHNIPMVLETHKGGYFNLVESMDNIVICEVFATGASIFEAKGYRVRCSFNRQKPQRSSHIRWGILL